MSQSLARNYSIVLSDPVQCANLQAQYPNGYKFNPTTASIAFNAPLPASQGGAQIAPPRIDTYGHSVASILPLNVDSVTWDNNHTINGDGVLFPFTNSGGGTIYWLGYFILEATAPAIPPPTALQHRRWACGFESPKSGDAVGITGPLLSNYSRDSSRTSRGRGLAYRSTYNSTLTIPTPISGGIHPSSSWERFYIRVRTRPSGGSDEFWFCNGSIEAGSSVLAVLDPVGTVSFYNKGNGVYPGTLLGSFGVLDLNVWYRVDLLIKYRPGPPVASLIAYLNAGNNGLVDAENITNGNGLGTIQTHISSSLGNEGLAVSSFGSEIDIDDWSNYDYPVFFNGVDWNSGSHIVLALPTGYDAASSNWTGDTRILEGNPVLGQLAADVVGSSVSNAPLVVNTDYNDIETKQIGCTAVTIGAYSKSAGGVVCQLGADINGARTTFPVTATTGQWNQAFIDTTAGSLVPNLLSTVNLTFLKSSDGTTVNLQALQAVCELIGKWGPEDGYFNGLGGIQNDGVAYPPRQGIHNQPYWKEPFSNDFQGPIAPITIMSGTYVGNGTGQDIPTQIPIHWWWCRPLSGNTGGSHWWSSLLAGHNQETQLPAVNRLIQARKVLSTGSYQVQISGTSPDINANGITYQWIGVSDPGMRYLINGAFSHLANVATAGNLIKDGSFLPDGVFFFVESQVGIGASQYWKGPGHATLAASPIVSAEVATVAQVTTGTIVSRTPLNIESPQTGFSAWRNNDGTGIGPVAIMTYTGDGTGSRVITLNLGGKSPLFALVVPHNGMSYFRDPSHSGVNSSQITGSNSTTAITAGSANQITIDAAINTNAIIYDVFILASDQTSGWGTNPSGVSTDPANPINPIIPGNTIQSTSGAFAPDDTHGWWGSVLGFKGAADIISIPQNPKAPRDWSKVSTFATGNAAMLGGAPGAGITFDNNLIYPGNDYSSGTSNPTIRIFDGTSDRLMANVPNTSSGVIPQALMSMIVNQGTIYFTTLDSGTTSANFAGRVFTLDPLSQNIAPLGTSTFSGGEVPYALVWHMGRLWMGTNKSDGTAGKVYFIRPGIDLDWTTDHNLSSDSTGGVCSMWSFQGKLYIGTDNTAGNFAKVIVRDSLGAYTTSLTATGGTARKNNGFLSLHDFQNNLYAGYWNPDTTAVAVVYKFDGTNWIIAYTGSSTTLRPYIGQFISENYLYVVGGGDALSASLVGTANGTTWDNLTPFLSGPTTETALPIFGSVGI